MREPLTVCAEIALAKKRPERAALLLANVARRFDQTLHFHSPVQQRQFAPFVAQARAAMTEAEYDAACAGRSRPLDGKGALLRP